MLNFVTTIPYTSALRASLQTLYHDLGESLPRFAGEILLNQQNPI